MGKYIFMVSDGGNNVSEYFGSRESAVRFIIDEFSMALLFRTETEGERLMEYMETHDETPNKYPYKYSIRKIALNTEYDKE